MPSILTTINAVMLLTLLIQVVLPLLVGLVTKRMHPAWAKAVLLVVLTLVNQYFTGWLVAAQGGQHFNFVAYAWNVIFGFVVSVASHYGFWVPTGITAVAQSSLVKDGTTAAPSGPPHA